MDSLLKQFPNVQQLFFKRYNKVFDEKGNVKVCGREATTSLIDLCNSIDSAREPDYYGNTVSGAMNVEHVKELCKQIKSHE